MALGIICVSLFYFRTSIWNGLAYVGQNVFRPVLILGNKISGTFETLGSYLLSKNFLYVENQALRSKLDLQAARILNYGTLFAENTALKEILGRKNENTPMITGAILAKPNQSPYDTLIIDLGEQQGLAPGDRVFALGNVPIGRITEVYSHSAKVVLFSNAGEKTHVVISLNPDSAGGADESLSMELVGRGGGNFEMTVPRELTVAKGTRRFYPVLFRMWWRLSRRYISDPRDSFSKALLTSPVNIQQLKFIEVQSTTKSSF